MWALRAAVRPGGRVSRWGGCVPRVVRCRGAPRVAPLPPPWPERALAAFGPGDPRGLQHRGGGGRGPRADGRGGRAGEEEEDEEPEGAEQEEEDVEELLSRAPLLPAGTQRVCLVHPEVKWGPGKQLQPRGDPSRGFGAGPRGRGFGGPEPGGGAWGGASGPGLIGRGAWGRSLGGSPSRGGSFGAGSQV